ncbi:MAG: acetolactate synthase small subunit [Myxococcota bacterium]|nr:acetolactate synthase small subunit [Myxococcales bacterium]
MSATVPSPARRTAAAPRRTRDERSAFVATKDASEVHTISLFVADKPGVLVRVALVFARRGYNIESLVVSPAKETGFSRMTITCSGERATLGHMIKQLTKLVDVVHAIDHTGDAAYETEIALVKVECESKEERSELLQLAEHFGAKVVDYGNDSMILRVYGASDKLDALLRLLADFDITELVRSGKLVMARGRATT